MRGSVICASTLGGLLIVRVSLGFGNPDTGDRFVGSGSKFDEVGDRIAALVPDGGWQGLAAQAYLSQNLAQSQRAKVIRDLDHQTGDLVSAQAQAVVNAREAANIGMVIAGIALGVCATCEATMGPPGQILSFQIALFMCSPAVALVVVFLIELAVAASQNASKLQAMTQRLTDLVTSLPTRSGPIPGLTDSTFPPAHPRSEFDGADPVVPPTIAGLPDDTAPRPETPDICLALADLPGSLEFSVPNLPSPGFPDFGAPHLPIPQLAGMPSLPNSSTGRPNLADVFAGGMSNVPTADELPALPGLAEALAAMPSLNLANLATMTSQPAMAQLAASLSQLTGLSGAAGGLGQLANTAARQAQMISSVTQQGVQQLTTPADHDIAGAATGTPTELRVPVDAATGTSQRRQQHVA
ncbi:hypothetical protein I545_1874 [Mycobacterium kansasii 662]|uniref:ESX-1 secretion-associated protein EspA/EspE-like domain-containing protein n=2 Tax=Mycobacterium kansasii TaxID=1768 RepID=A0A1V3XJM3_MYCKA|nr:hypothetical protein I545_1874 [Mycobacterium kansasii 662]KEP39951.1 hypothetical protein MKSMC1_49990 [Mycobacterium kansasii]OOK79413.1 hypothetical protein BZL30_2490 [Mycobacterium kansasii]